MSGAMDPARRCTAKAKSTGERCKRRPIIGGTVCKVHGGGAPQVKAAARARLAGAVDPAISVLIQMVTSEVEVVFDDEGRPHEVGPRHADRIRASEAILDRAGYPKRTEVDLTDSRERIVAQLRALRDAAR